MSSAAPSAGWRGHLSLRYWRDGPRTVAHDRHEGPLRVLQRLYPEGEAICHHVLVHPPGGVAGGDELEVQAELTEGTHALITTPGATRFYRSGGRKALQRARLSLASSARLEWLPLENIAFAGCEAENRTELCLNPGAETLGWDLLALGLPAAASAFDAGAFTQHLSLTLTEPAMAAPSEGPDEGPDAERIAPGAAPRGRLLWLERGRVDAADRKLLDSPLGWAGCSVLATVWWAAGTPLSPARREMLMEAARGCSLDPSLEGQTGITSPLPQVLVARALAHRVEPAMQWMCAVRAAWRHAAWGLKPNPPRVWRT